MLKVSRRTDGACGAYLLTLGLLLCATVAWGAKQFPVKGTAKADTIEVRQFLGPNDELVEVLVNGEKINYLMPDSSKDRVIKAGAGDDEITIKAHARFIVYGQAGDDEIHGGAYDDVLIGGNGKDTIRGFGGHDWISGDAGKDHLYGGEGNDIIYGNTSEDTIRGGPGNDLIDGGAATDTIWGEAGDDQLYGETGDDHIRGGPGNDLVFGGKGDDTLRGDAGDDILIGDSGSDKKEDSSVMSETAYENSRVSEAKDIESDFGVDVGDSTRKWTPKELGFLRAALEALPSKVLNMWDGTPSTLTYMRKELYTFAFLDPNVTDFGVSGLKSLAIWIYDLQWANSDSRVQTEFVETMIHETGHAYEASPALTSKQWKAFKAISGWKGSWPGGTFDPNATFVSGYAETNAKEDWAESFMNYFLDPSKLKTKAIEKFDFLNDIFGLYGVTATPTPVPPTLAPVGPPRPPVIIAPRPRPRPPVIRPRLRKPPRHGPRPHPWP